MAARRQLALLVPVTLLTVALTGCSLIDSFTAPTDAKLEKAIVAGDWTKVVQRCDAWHARQPSNPVPAYVAFEAYYRQGEYDECQPAFNRLTEGASRFSLYPRLVSWAHALVRRHPKSARAYGMAACMLIAAQRKDEAFDVATKAINLNPKDPGPWAVRGELYYRERQLKPALADYSKAIALGSTDPNVYISRGLVYFGQSDILRAYDDFSHAVKLAPSKEMCYLERASMAESLGRFDQARSDADKIIELAPKKAAGYAERTALRRLLGDEAGAESDARKVRSLTATPQDSYGFSYRALASMVLHDYDDALRSASEAIDMSPNNPGFYRLRSTIYCHVGALDQALTDASRAVARGPRDAETHRMLGYVFLARHNDDRALTELNRSVDLAPHDPAGYVDRGLAYEAKGDKAAAKRDFDKAASLTPYAAKIIAFERHELATIPAKSQLKPAPSAPSHSGGSPQGTPF